MRVVGARKERPISFNASGCLLAEGARFNEEIHRLPTGGNTGIPMRGYFFRTHEEANRHQSMCLENGMARVAQEPR